MVVSLLQTILKTFLVYWVTSVVNACASILLHVMPVTYTYTYMDICRTVLHIFRAKNKQNKMDFYFDNYPNCTSKLDL